jgi:serine/threonine protein kinase
MVTETTLGPYRLIRRLGGGGMGEVYLAQAGDGHEVALKLIPMREDRDSRDIVAAERVGARLQQLFGATDPHVPAVHRVGEADGYFFIEMEYVDGHDLAELIAGGLPPEQAGRIAVEIASFLEKAHGFSAQVEGREFRALVHADLKPKNIRISAAGEVKVLDFGIAKGLSMTGRLTTAAFGSRLYMSPEWLDTGRLDQHVDLWAAGVVLYEMIAGHTPYRTENDRQLELALRSGTPPLPLPAACPPALRRIVFKALAPSQGARYQTAAGLRDELAAWLEGRTTVAEAEAETGKSEATRRTARPPASIIDSDPTRRTTLPAAVADGAPTVRTQSTPMPAPADGTLATATPSRSLGRRLRRWGSRAVLAAILLVIVNEHLACQTAATLRADLPTRDAANLDEAWDRYERIDSRSLLGIARLEVTRAMQEALVTNANRVIADFRHDRPIVRERQWQQARTWLTHALQLGPGNTTLVARLRYCEAHLSRIDGEARLGAGQRQEADRHLHDAVARFEEAARLDKSWPDPWLGLLRTYVYGLEDLGKATAALNEAERRGHRAGRREFLQLGEAHLGQAERSRRECDPLPPEPRCACLRRTSALYGQSIVWFERVDRDADTSRGLLRAHARQAAVEAKLVELGCGWLRTSDKNQ